MFDLYEELEYGLVQYRLIQPGVVYRRDQAMSLLCCLSIPFLVLFHLTAYL